MNSFLIKEQYKVTQVLCTSQNYAAFQAVDITDREKHTVLLNAYEGELLKEYLHYYDKLKYCGDYKGMFISGETLITVFDFKHGTPIDKVFFKGAEVTAQDRLAFAQELFHLALSAADFPYEIGCCSFLSENLILNTADKTLAVNYLVRPLGELNERELIFLLTDQIKKVFLRRFTAARSETAFLERLEYGEFTSVVELYSSWLKAKEVIEEEYKMISEKTALARFIYLLMSIVKRRLKRKKG